MRIHTAARIQADRRPATARHHLVSALTVAALATACGGTGAGGADATGTLDGSDLTLDPAVETVYTVGALEGEGWETFGNLGGVGFDGSGNLYIFDRDASTITVVGPDGEHLRTFGQAGGGPGELQQPFAFAVLPDGRSIVFDFGHRAFQIYGPGGAFREAVTLDPMEGMPGSTILPAGPGSLVSWGGIRMQVSGNNRSVTMGGDDDARPIDRFALADGTRETAYEAWNPPPPEGDASELDMSSDGGRRMRISMAPMVAFQAGLHVGALSDGRVVVADSVGYRVKIVDQAGGVTTLERPIEPIAVTEEIRERERELRLAGIQTGAGRMIVLGGSGGGSVDPDAMRRMMEERVESMQFAAEIPVIADVAVDGSDRIWVERSAEPGEEGPIDIVGPDGHYYGTIAAGGPRIPDAFGPDGLMAYIETDELDVQRIRVARLQADEALETGS